MIDLPELPPIELPSWLQGGSCAACGGLRSDMVPAWDERQLRSLSVYLSGDPSCRSAGLAAALSERMLDHAWAAAHRGCAVSCPNCGVVASLLGSHGSLLHTSERIYSGSIRCEGCLHSFSVVGVRSHRFIPPIPRIDGLTWCGNRQGCIAAACPLRGS